MDGAARLGKLVVSALFPKRHVNYAGLANGPMMRSGQRRGKRLAAQRRQVPASGSRDPLNEAQQQRSSNEFCCPPCKDRKTINIADMMHETYDHPSPRSRSQPDCIVQQTFIDRVS